MRKNSNFQTTSTVESTFSDHELKIGNVHQRISRMKEQRWNRGSENWAYTSFQSKNHCFRIRLGDQLNESPRDATAVVGRYCLGCSARRRRVAIKLPLLLSAHRLLLRGGRDQLIARYRPEEPACRQYAPVSEREQQQLYSSRRSRSSRVILRGRRRIGRGSRAAGECCWPSSSNSVARAASQWRRCAASTFSASSLFSRGRISVVVVVVAAAQWWHETWVPGRCPCWVARLGASAWSVAAIKVSHCASRGWVSLIFADLSLSQQTHDKATFASIPTLLIRLSVKFYISRPVEQYVLAKLLRQQLSISLDSASLSSIFFALLFVIIIRNSFSQQIFVDFALQFFFLYVIMWI